VSGEAVKSLAGAMAGDRRERGLEQLKRVDNVAFAALDESEEGGGAGQEYQSRIWRGRHRAAPHCGGRARTMGIFLRRAMKARARTA
jgi:hypothetical protein